LGVPNRGFPGGGHWAAAGENKKNTAGGLGVGPPGFRYFWDVEALTYPTPRAPGCPRSVKAFGPGDGPGDP